MSENPLRRKCRLCVTERRILEVVSCTLPKWRWRYLVVLGWLFALLSGWFYTRAQGHPPTALLGTALDALRGDPLAPLWLLLVYLVRPLLLLPITLLTVSAGMLFGALWGGVYGMVGALLSSGVAYFFGRLFRKDVGAKDSSGWLGQLTKRPFETVLLCRFLGVPGDLLNYAAGYLRISFAAFVGATFIGGAPGILVGTLAGASLNSVTNASFSLRWEFLLASAALLLVSLAVSWAVRRRSSLLESGNARGSTPD